MVRVSFTWKHESLKALIHEPIRPYDWGGLPKPDYMFSNSIARQLNSSEHQFQLAFSKYSVPYSKWMNCIHQEMSACCLNWSDRKAGGHKWRYLLSSGKVENADHPLALTGQFWLYCVAVSTFKRWVQLHEVWTVLNHRTETAHVSVPSEKLV